MRVAEAGYNDRIFINCPFDPSYYHLFRAIIFAVYRCGFVPVSALSFNNGAQNRLSKIQECIDSAHYGIHDISTINLNANHLPRFNMPFELGLFFGAKAFGGRKHKEKDAIIFDKDEHRYKEFISDLSGVDINAHNNDPDVVIKLIRNWLSIKSGRTLPGELVLLKQYANFKKTLPRTAKSLGFIKNDIPYNDYCTLVEDAVALFLRAQ